MNQPFQEIVSLVRCTCYELKTVKQALISALHPWGGLSAFIRKGQRVLLKPNLLTAAPPEEAVTTHPVVVRALVELVAEYGAHALVGDSPGAISFARVCEVTGITEAIRGTGAELMPFDSLGYCRNDDFTKKIYPLTGALEQVDAIINVGKLKTHSLTGLTAAVKNNYGLLVGRHKARLHLEYPLPGDFAGLLLDISQAVKPCLSIVDAVIAMEGPGPRHGRPRRAGLLIAGRSAVAVDTVAAAITGFRPGQLPIINAALRRRLPGARLDEIKITGLSIAEATISDFDRGVAGGNLPAMLWRFPFSLVRNLQLKRRSYPRVIPDRCTGCGICRDHCPPQVIKLSGGKAEINTPRCIRCYCCQELCPANSLELAGRRT